MEPFTCVNNGNISCFYTTQMPTEVYNYNMIPKISILWTFLLPQNTPHLSLFPVDNCDPNIYTTIKSTVWTTEIPKAVQLNADNDNDIVH